jgi:anti-sigma regulatory factor (Ser/Thr protein kinase)
MMPRPSAHRSLRALTLPHRVPMAARPVIRVLPGVPESAAAARQVARQLLGDGHPAADTAMLLVSELVTNSVTHSKSGRPGGTVTVAVCAGATSVLIQVRDDGGASEPRLPPGQANVTADAAASAEHGYGLLLVDALAETWGTISTKASRVTWCRLAVGDLGSGPQPDPDRRA